MISTSIKLNKNCDRSLYLQLADAILQQITAGVLLPDERLPAIRRLAKELNVNTVTIVSAYKHLEQGGFVYSKRGSGTFVAHSQFTVSRVKGRTNTPQMVAEKRPVLEDVIDFATASPTPEMFPIEDFRRTIDEVLDRDRGRAFTYQEVEGYYPLRETIVQTLGNEGIGGSPEQILITSGSQLGIDILSKALLRPNDMVIAEEPTYDGAIAVFRSRGARIEGIPIADEGIDCHRLEDVLKTNRIKLLYLMPDFQNPTGKLTSLKARRDILQLASLYDFIIVEDDHVRDLRYQGEAVPTLKSLDKDDRVIYLKSFSKVFMPGLRLAFMNVPKRIYKTVYAAKQLTDISTTGLSQRSFELYLRKGMWREHLKYLRGVFGERYQIMLTMLKSTLPTSVDFTIPLGGLYFWLELPAALDESQFHAQLHSRGVHCVSGTTFFLREQERTRLRLSFATAVAPEIIKGVEILSQSIRDVL